MAMVKKKPSVRKMRLYAIGLRGWVEIREAKFKPKAVETSFEKTVEVPTMVYEHGDWGRFRGKKVMQKREHKFTLLTYVGGVYKTTVKPDAIANLTGRMVHPDECYRIPLAYENQVRELLAQPL